MERGLMLERRICVPAEMNLAAILTRTSICECALVRHLRVQRDYAEGGIAPPPKGRTMGKTWRIGRARNVLKEGNAQDSQRNLRAMWRKETENIWKDVNG